MSSGLKLNPNIFRAYDIRGVVDVDIDPSIAELIGKTVGTYLLQRNKGNNVVVGMDNRPSSETLKQSLVKGLMSTGCNVTDIGLCTSPMLYKAVYDGDFCGGVIVSASHNPKEDNGFKIVAENAYPVAGEEIYKIRDMAFAGKFTSGNGSYTTFDTEEIYLKKIESIIHLERKLKVVIDTGNGVAGKFAPNLFRRLGCEVVEVFCELDGTFPNHLPNPEHETNLLDAKRVVVETGADLGIGIDGDGDRVGLIDEKGNFLSSDYSVILLARDYLQRHSGDQVLTDVKSSQNVIDEIIKNGGKSLLYKTGHSLIKMKMRSDNISLGGEFSGHLYVFENYYPFDDALYAASKILEILSKSPVTLSAQFSGLKKLYPTNLLELGCPDSIKFDVMKKVAEAFSASHDVFDIDGVRVAFKDGWAILRASNTTPYLTFRAEGSSNESLKQILIEMQEVLMKYPEIKLDLLNQAIQEL